MASLPVCIIGLAVSFVSNVQKRYRRGSLGGSTGHMAAWHTIQALCFWWNILQISLGFQQYQNVISKVNTLQNENNMSCQNPPSYLGPLLATSDSLKSGNELKENIFFRQRLSELRVIHRWNSFHRISHFTFWCCLKDNRFLMLVFLYFLIYFFNFSFSSSPRKHSFGIKKTCLG